MTVEARQPESAAESPAPPQPPYPPASYPMPVYVARPPGRFARFWLRMWARSPRWLAPAAILACFASAVGYVLIREPTDGAFDEPTCLLKFTTGYDCPGCGGTRALYFLAQGNLPAAARHHLVFVFALPFLLYTYAAWAGDRVFRWRIPQLRPSPWMIGIFIASIGVFTVLRNLPWEPFTWFYV